MYPSIRKYTQDFHFIYSLNFFISFIYWLIFHPGLFSADSFVAYEMAKSGNLSNSFTASWALYVRYFSLLGEMISLLTLINALVLTYAVTKFCIVLFERKIAGFVAFLICLSPGVSGMGITLWHDVPMTSGFLLLFTSLAQFQKRPETTRASWIDLILGAVMITFRPNGLPTLFLILLFAIAIKRLHVFVKLIAMSVIIAGSATIFGSYIGIGQPPINKYFSQEWMRNDISCFAAKSKMNDFERVTKISQNLHSSWKSNDACTFLNGFKLSREEKENSLNYVPKSWLRLVKNEPIFIFETHLKRNAYLNPIPLFGIPSVPFLHTNIEFADKGIKWTFPTLALQFRPVLRAWNYIKPITGWVGLWIAIIAGVCIKKRDDFLQLLLSFAASMAAVLFVFAPIPDGRYGLFILITGQATLLNQLHELYLKIWNVND